MVDQVGRLKRPVSPMSRRGRAFWALHQQRRRQDPRAALIAALFGNGEEGAFYERDAVSDFSATHADLSGNANGATLAGDTYSVTLPDLGTDATVAYATPESIVIVDGQTVSGATALNDRWLTYLIVDRALTASERALLVSWMGASGATEPDFYVDSVNGNDGNTGTEADAAFATLGAAQTAALAHGNNVHVALVAGSEWRETIDLSSLTGAKITGIGTLITDGLPVVRGDDVIAGDWDDSTDRADAHTNVYSQSISWSGAAGTVIWLTAWEDDTRLSWAADLATCQSTAGTFHIPGASGAVDADGSGTLYVHPSGSTNPASDGKAYEATIRARCAIVGDDGLIAAVHGRRAAHNNGPLVGGRSSTICGGLADGSVLHQILSVSGVQRYCVGWDEAQDARSGQIILEFYTPDGRGLSCTWDHCIAVSVTDQTDSGFGGHTNGTDFYDAWTMRDCALSQCVIGGNDVTAVSIIRPHLVDAGITGIVAEGDGAAVSITDPWIEWGGGIAASILIQRTAVHQMTISGLRAYLTHDYERMVFDASAGGEGLTLTRSVIVDALPGAEVDRRWCAWASGGADADYSVSGCVFDGSRAESALTDEMRAIRLDAGHGGYSASNNVFWPDTKNFCQVQFEGTLYTTPTAYLTAVQPGNETGSAVVDPQLADPANGDFTAAGSMPANCGLERDPTCQLYTPIPASLAEAETWIIKNAA